MLDLNVDIKLDRQKPARHHKQKIKAVQKAFDALVLADSNFFIPKDKSHLEKSGTIATVIGQGRVVWNAPYAKRQYYGVGFKHSKQKNPNASAKWFERAKAKWTKKWEDFVNERFKSS